MQRGCSPASPKTQDILKFKGDRKDKTENKMRRWKEETDTRSLRNNQAI